MSADDVVAAGLVQRVGTGDVPQHQACFDFRRKHQGLAVDLDSYRRQIAFAECVADTTSHRTGLADGEFTKQADLERLRFHWLTGKGAMTREVARTLALGNV